MMEVEDQTHESTEVWMEDKDGDQDMPEVGGKNTMDTMEDMPDLAAMVVMMEECLNLCTKCCSEH